MKAIVIALAVLQTASPAKSTSDPKLHADAEQLVDLSGARQRITDSSPTVMAQSRKAFAEHCPNCSPAFIDAWVEGMRKAFNPEEYLAVYVGEYEKFFSDAELLELIAMQKKINNKEVAEPSPALKDRLTKVAPELLSEIMGRCSQIGARHGIEIAAELTKAHPEWVTSQPAGPSTSAKQ